MKKSLSSKMKSMEKGGDYIRELTFGVEDGLVSTLGFVVGMTTAAVSSRIIIIGGLAEAVAAGISMAAGTYLSVKSQAEFFSYLERKIKRGGKREIRTECAASRRAGAKLRANKKDIHSHIENPGKASLVMFISFMIMALIPLAPYFFLEAERALKISILATMLALFIFGAEKTRITKKSWFKSGVEMTAIGAIAALAGYLVGVIANIYFGA